MKVKNLIPAVLLALALSATFALADHFFVGEGSGECDNIHPWAAWDGFVDTDPVTPDFYGEWEHGIHYGDIFGEDLSYNSQYGCYYESEGTWDCNTQMDLYGKWEGYFCPGSDTADGTWWDISGWNCDGTWWGNNAD